MAQRPKKGSNDDWQHPHDRDARITKMKDGSTHLAHKLEHAVDMDSGAVVAVTVQEATGGDGKSLQATVAEADNNLEQVSDGTQEGGQLREVVLDRGYHSNAALVYLQQHGIRSYVAEPMIQILILTRSAQPSLTGTALAGRCFATGC